MVQKGLFYLNMAEKTQSRSNEWPDPARITLRGLYVIIVMSMGIGITVVFVLNFATPTDFVLNQFADFARKTGFDYGLEVCKRLVGLFVIIAAMGSPTLR
jgi:ABC-type nickel/cobalt efflux system permease component RcnA